MTNQQNKNEKQNTNTINTRQGAGSEYHREHASHVPDYGANSTDPNAEKMMNKTDRTEA